MKVCGQVNTPTTNNTPIACKNYYNAECVLYQEPISYFGYTDPTPIKELFDTVIQSLVDARGRIYILESAVTPVDSAITNVELIGSNLNFTGIDGAFNGAVDLSSISAVGGVSAVWGGITGILSEQTDLDIALSTKAGLSDNNYFTGFNNYFANNVYFYDKIVLSDLIHYQAFTGSLISDNQEANIAYTGNGQFSLKRDGFVNGFATFDINFIGSGEKVYVTPASSGTLALQEDITAHTAPFVEVTPTINLLDNVQAVLEDHETRINDFSREVGIFAPTLNLQTTTQTGVITTGYYVKNGRLLDFIITFKNITTTGAPTGTPIIGNLPYSAVTMDTLIDVDLRNSTFTDDTLTPIEEIRASIVSIAGTNLNFGYKNNTATTFSPRVSFPGGSGSIVIKGSCILIP